MRLHFLAIAVACAPFTAAVPARAQLPPTATPAPPPPLPPLPQLRNVPAVVSGSLLITAGTPLHVVGAVMMASASASKCDSSPCDRKSPAGLGLMLGGLGALAIGIPLVIWGAREVPRQTASMPAWVGAPGGTGWRWQF